MIQGFNPRTGEPAGKPVAETTGAEGDAAVQAAAAALPEWAGLGGPERARALGPASRSAPRRRCAVSRRPPGPAARPGQQPARIRA